MSEAKQAFDELIDALQSYQQRLDGIEGLTDVDLADNYRHMADLTAIAIDCYVQNDTARPRWVSLVAAHRKVLGDNQHARYFYVPLSHEYAYRVKGSMNGACYMGFTVYGSEGEDKMHIVANTSTREIKLAPDGSFDITLSADAVGNNGIALSEQTNALMVRQYFDTPAPDHAIPVTIEVLSGPEQSPLPSTEQIARRLRTAASLIRGWAGLNPIPWPQEASAYNVISDPVPTSVGGGGNWSTPDNIHAMGFFDLAPGQALVMSGKAVRSLYWSCHLWNSCMQTFDYERFQCAVSGNQLKIADDGTWTIIVANHPPQGQHWLETGGRDRGFIYFRWLLSDSQPGSIATRVVPVESLI